MLESERFMTEIPRPKCPDKASIRLVLPHSELELCFLDEFLKFFYEKNVKRHQNITTEHMTAEK